MAEPAQEQAQTEQPVTAQPEKKKKSPLFWIAVTGCGCLLLLGCISSVLGYLCVTSDEFREEYCNQLEEQGMSRDEDPFGLCD